MPYAQKRDGKLTGRWFGEVMVAKVRYRQLFDSKKEAAGYEAYVKATGMEPAGVAPTALDGPTFSEVAKDARAASDAAKRQRDPSGLQRLDWAIEKLGHLPIKAVTTEELDRVVSDLAARPGTEGRKMSNGTINRYLSAISAVLTFAGDRRIIPHHPVIPWRKEDGHRTAFMDEELERKVCAYMVSRGWLASALSVRVLILSGMRFGEFSSVPANACTSEWIKLDKTKTDTPRDIPMDPKTLGEFRALIQQNARPKYRTLRKHLTAAVKACGGPEGKLGIHNLRHTTATRLNDKDVPTATIQQFLGHKNIQTTMKYLHVENKALLAASKKISPRVGEEPEIHRDADVVAFKKSC